MKKYLKEKVVLIVVSVTIIMTGLSMIYALTQIDKFAREGCYETMQDATEQAAALLEHHLKQHQSELIGLSKVLGNVPNEQDYGASIGANLDEIVHKRLESFAHITLYSGISLLQKDGSIASHGEVPAHHAKLLSFEEEKERYMYLDTLLLPGESREHQYIYRAVPVISDNEVTGMLYGYIRLDTLAKQLTSNDYDGEGHLLLFDAKTGDILVDEAHRYDKNGQEIPLGNLYNISKQNFPPVEGSSWKAAEINMRNREKGFLAYRMQETGVTRYLYYLPMRTNRWMLAMMLEEKMALAPYDDIRRTIYLFIGIASFIILGVFVLGLFILHHIKKRKTLKQISTHDYLTEVGNRYAMYEFADKLQPGQSVAVFYCDVTGLKRLNDEQGHQAGDAMLKRMTECMVAAFEHSQVFRLGGDEFLVLYPTADRAEAERRLQAMQELWERSGIVVAVGYDWIASYNGDVDALTLTAEQRMYEAKSKWYKQSGVDRRRR